MISGAMAPPSCLNAVDVVGRRDDAPDGRCSAWAPFFHGIALGFGSAALLAVLRAYLVPNVTPFWFDRWRAVSQHHFGFLGLYGGTVGVCVVAAFVFGSYYPVVSRNRRSFPLWLVTGAWLGLAGVAAVTSPSEPSVVARQATLLIGYVSGLAVARLFRRQEPYIAALVACGALQSVIAVGFRSAGVHRYVSDGITRAAGTLDAPSDLYLIPLFVLPLAIHGILSARTTLSSTFHMVCAGSMFAALVLTWHLAGFVASLVALFWIAGRQVAVRPQRSVLAMVLLLLVVAFYMRVDAPRTYGAAVGAIRSPADLYETGLRIFRHHWLDGVGVGRLGVPVPLEISGHTSNVQMPNPQCQVLVWLDEMGIAGGVLAALLVAAVIGALRGASSPIVPGVAGAWLAVLVAGFYGTLFGLNPGSCGNMLIGSLLGLTMRLASAGEDGEPEFARGLDRNAA